MTTPADEITTAADRMRTLPDPVAEPIADWLEQTAADHPRITHPGSAGTECRCGDDAAQCPTVRHALAVARAINDHTEQRQQRPCGEVRKAHGGHQYMLGARVYDCPGGQHTHHDSHTGGRAAAPCRTTRHCVNFGFCNRCAPALAKAATHVVKALSEVGKQHDGEIYARAMEVIAERDADRRTPAPSAFPEVQGHCPACRGASLFLASGGYVTCSRIDCPEPDAASTLLERRSEQAGCSDAAPETEPNNTDPLTLTRDQIRLVRDACNQLLGQPSCDSHEPSVDAHDASVDSTDAADARCAQYAAAMASARRDSSTGPVLAHDRMAEAAMTVADREQQQLRDTLAGYEKCLRQLLDARTRLLDSCQAQEERAEQAEHRLRLAHQARRAKEHQLDDIRRALCDTGLMQDDDPYSHADLADVIRDAGPPGPDDAEITAILDTVRRVLGIDTTTVPADIGGWLLTACRELEKSETARRHLRERLRESEEEVARQLHDCQQAEAAIERVRVALAATEAISPDDPLNTTAQIADCVHPEGYDGECPCLTGCGCCKVAMAPHPAATQATEPGAKVRDTWLRHTLEPGQVRRLLDDLSTALDQAEPEANPPGSTKEQLPNHLLALIRGSIPDYTSTACVTADTLAVAVHWSHPRLEEIREHAERLHNRCRLNQKFTGQLCVCGCHTNTTKEPTP